MKGILVRYRTTEGIQETRVNLRGEDTVRDLIGRLVHEATDSLETVGREALDESSVRFVVVLNGTNVRSLEGLATPIRDADVLSIMPIVVGG